ncbi:(2Fe-2S)-binding protein [Janibacter corallicola]|uniref:(2Fe-2S)-binding protein n=1 Tax=Janibacter corallicola TaxID=415212 RepID=UPI00083249C2|nr:(2Fe-2S)-binding protein [Janibacter corallicola]
MNDRHLIELTVNGEEHELLVEARETLVDVLRHRVGATGTHVACEHGICGACTVLVDGEPTRSCLVLGVMADGSEVRTVESLADEGGLNDLQEAFTDCHSLQCGFCTPGMLMLAEGGIPHLESSDREEIRELVSANLCRCTGYETIVDAVGRVARHRRGETPDTSEGAPA